MNNNNNKNIEVKNNFKYAQAPLWLMEREEVSQGAKLTYSSLVNFSGKRGTYPSLEKLAKSIGTRSRTSIIKYLKELEDLKLIEIIRTGQSKNNRYKFLSHKWNKKEGEDGKINKINKSLGDVQVRKSDVQIGEGDVQHVEHPIVKEKVKREKRETSSLYVYDSTVENQENRQRKKDINIKKEKKYENPEEINVQQNKNPEMEIDEDEKFGVCDDEVETFRKLICERYPYQTIFSTTKNVREKFRRFLFGVKNFESDKNFIRNNGKYFDKDYIQLLVSCIEDVGYKDMKPGNLLNDFMFNKIVRHYFTVWERGDPDYGKDQK